MNTNMNMPVENPLCQYRDVFGSPGEGAHSYRFMGVAIVDVVLTILGGWMIALASGWPVWKVMIGVFVAGIVFHRLFCVNTTVNTLLFGRV